MLSLKKFNDSFLSHLREMVLICSTYKNQNGREQMISYVKEALSNSLRAHTIEIDQFGNLVAYSNLKCNTHTNIYLNAHVDTALAEPEKWTLPYHPFIPYEDDYGIVARGVNDCKAGVAFQLALAECIDASSSEKIVYTFTSKEEGPGEKTSIAIGRRIGYELPIATKNTYLFVLENTTSVEPDYMLSAYDSERSNYAVEAIAGLRLLKDFLIKNPNWTVVAIEPEVREDMVMIDQVLCPLGAGHIASRGSKTIIDQVICNHPVTRLKVLGGTSGDFATAPGFVNLYKSKSSINRHRITLNFRGDLSPVDARKQLESLSYKELKPFDISSGFNAENSKSYKCLIEEIFKIKKLGYSISISENIGNSDASYIKSALDSRFSELITPLVIGSGCRSQKNKEPKRMTHGVNETLVKQAAFKSNETIVRLIQQLLGS